MSDPQVPREDASAAPAAQPEPAAPAAPETPPAAAAESAVVRDDVVTATLRRSPKYTVFLLLGAALGIIIALVLTFAFPGTQQPSEEGFTYSQVQVFGFLTLICVPVGLALAGVVALLLDRAASRRARELAVERERYRAGP